MSQQVKLLSEIARSMQELNRKLERLVELQSRIVDSRAAATPRALQQSEPLDAFTLMELPDHLRRTALAMYEIQRGTAEEICALTGNSRSIESAYLNQLQRQGYVKKERGSRSGENPKKVYFYI